MEENNEQWETNSVNGKIEFAAYKNARSTRHECVCVRTSVCVCVSERLLHFDYFNCNCAFNEILTGLDLTWLDFTWLILNVLGTLSRFFGCSHYMRDNIIIVYFMPLDALFNGYVFSLYREMDRKRKS